MRSRKILNAIGKIDDELVLEAMTMPSEKKNTKRIHWVKYGALAACLCLLLALPIVATQRDMLVEIFSDMTGWRVQAKECYTNKDFSKEVRDLSKELAGDRTYLPMDNLEQVETFLGIEIPDNSLLTEDIKDEVHLEFEVNGQRTRYDTPCLVYVAFSEDGSVLAADTNAAYRYRGIPVTVMYRMPTEYAVSIGGGSIGSQGPNISQAQTYITPSGRECAVFYTADENGIFAGFGYTVVDSVLVEVSAISRLEEAVQQTIIEVLGGF